MKKLNFKKISFILIPVALLIPGIMIVKSVTSSASRIVLKDQLKTDKIILHDAKGDHACHCFSPVISGWQIKNITDVSASFRWVCSQPSTYQVDYGTTSSKGTRYPATRPSATFTDNTVTVTGLKPNTQYYAGPRSHDPKYAGDGGGTGGDKLWFGSTDRTSGTSNAFKTLPAAAATFTIQGSVLDNKGAGISGVKVTLSGDSSASVTTPSAGTYSFANLKQGKNYTITPTKTGFTYSPANKAFSALAADQSSQNFVQVTSAVMRDYTQQPLIYSITTSKITTTDAAITWKTNVPATSQVEYGTTRNFGLITGENMEMTTDHYIQLFDLTQGATYYFRAISKTGLGKASSSSSDVTTLTTRSIENRIANKASCFTEPNPCSDRVEFHYDLYQPINNLTIDILTLSGKKVAVLESPSSALVIGGNRIAWNVKDGSGAPLINGLYVYIMKLKKGNDEEILERSQFMVRR